MAGRKILESWDLGNAQEGCIGCKLEFETEGSSARMVDSPDGSVRLVWKPTLATHEGYEKLVEVVTRV